MQLILRQLCSHCHLVTCARRSSRKTRLVSRETWDPPRETQNLPWDDGLSKFNAETHKTYPRTNFITVENVQSDKRCFAYKKEHVIFWQITRSEPKSHELDRQLPLPKSTIHNLLLSIFQRKLLFLFVAGFATVGLPAPRPTITTSVPGSSNNCFQTLIAT